MHNPTFKELQSQLLESGVASKQVQRIMLELGDHLEDLRLEALHSGLDAVDAERYAIERLGDQQLLADNILEHTEFRTWVYRYPRVARIYLPIAYALLLPATPVIVGFRNPAIVVRWGAALMLSGAVTAGLFLFMQLSIILT